MLLVLGELYPPVVRLFPLRALVVGALVVTLASFLWSPGSSLPGGEAGPAWDAGDSGGGITLGPEQRVTATPDDQWETCIAVDPHDRANLLAASHDIWSLIPLFTGDIWIGAYSSRDGGASWLRQPVPGRFGGLLPGVQPLFKTFDPVCAFSGAGVAVVAGLNNDPHGAAAVFVTASIDGGTTWLQPTFPFAATRADDGLPLDKPEITADPEDSWVYVVWENFPGGGVEDPSRIEFAASLTGVGAWTGPKTVSQNPDKYVKGAHLAVGADHTVHLMYAELAVDDVWEGGRLFFTKSTDHGLTWTAPTAIEDQAPVSGHNRPNGFPSLALDRSGGPRHGWLYVVWSDDALGNADVWLKTSSDGGTTWTERRRVNQDETVAPQLFPAAAVGEDGSLYVSFYDARPGPFWYFGTVSRDGGQTFTEAALSTVPSGIREDYTDIVALPGGGAQAVWTDKRAGSADIWTRSFA